MVYREVHGEKFANHVEEFLTPYKFILDFVYFHYILFVCVWNFVAMNWRKNCSSIMVTGCFSSRQENWKFSHDKSKKKIIARKMCKALKVFSKWKWSCCVCVLLCCLKIYCSVRTQKMEAVSLEPQTHYDYSVTHTSTHKNRKSADAFWRFQQARHKCWMF